MVELVTAAIHKEEMECAEKEKCTRCTQFVAPVVNDNVTNLSFKYSGKQSHYTPSFLKRRCNHICRTLCKHRWSGHEDSCIKSWIVQS